MSPPTINVNLKPCTCQRSMLVSGLPHHAANCPGAPVLIPCPCPIPHSVTIQVALGECACEMDDWWWVNKAKEHAALEVKVGRTWTATSGCACGACRAARDAGWFPGFHRPNCPARPIRVCCSISSPDGTWANSEVDISTVEPSDPLADRVKIMAACRTRWGLVKALVLGMPLSLIPGIPRGSLPLVEQRDAVFAALCEMALDENARIEIKRRLFKACSVIFPKSGVTVPAPEARESATYLAAYVEGLIEQMGVLP